MKHLITLLVTLSLVFSAHSASAAFVPNVEGITMAGKFFPIADSQWGNSAGKYQMLTCSTYDGSTGRQWGECIAQDQQGTTAYSIPSGVTGTVLAIKLIAMTATNCFGQLGYADTAIGLDGNSSPTNPVYQIATGFGIYGTGAVVGNTTEFISRFSFPATKFPFFYATSSLQGCIAQVLVKLN